MNKKRFKEIALADNPNVKALVRVGYDCERDGDPEGDLFVEITGVQGCDVERNREYFTIEEDAFARFDSIKNPEDLGFDVSKMDSMVDKFKILDIGNTQALVRMVSVEFLEDDEEFNNGISPYEVEILISMPGFAEARWSIGFDDPMKSYEAFTKIDENYLIPLYEGAQKFYE